MDLMFVSGVNHMFFHGTTYSPKEAKWPGWKFYASIDMSPTNNIWRDAPSFFEYISRCQSFLQWGKPDNDFLVYLPVYDMWQEQPGRFLTFSIHEMAHRAPKFIETVNTINRCGYDMDYISDSFVQSTKCVNGKLVTKGGTSYKAIIIPAVKLMPTKVLAHLLKLAQAGATVIFTENYPQDVPGFGNLANRRTSFKQIARTLPQVSFGETTVTPYHKGTIITGSDYQSALAGSGVSPEAMKSQFGLQSIRRQNPTGHHYFISSLQDKGVDGWVTLAVDAKDAMLFNPMTGEKGKAKLREENGKTQVYLQLQSGESTILQTFDQPLSNVTPWKYIQEQSVSLSLDHGWELTFVESTPAVGGTFHIDTPSSWTTLNHPNAKITMATGLYTNEFTLPAMPADDWVLCLGDVRESARVRINGQMLGTAWAVPYQLKVGKWLKPGKNVIEVEVTNLPANRITDMDKRGEVWRIFNEINVVDLNYKKSLYKWDALPSGLNSAVRLIPVNYK